MKRYWMATAWVAIVLSLGAGAARSQPPHDTKIPGKEAQAQARPLLDLAVAAAKEIPPGEAIYPRLAELQALAGDMAGALASAEASGPARDHAFGGIVRSQARLGDPSGALKTADSIRDEVLRASALAEVALARTQAKDFDGALQIVESRLRYSAVVPDLVEQSSTPAERLAGAVYGIAWRMAEAGELDRAHALLQKLLQPPLRARLSNYDSDPGRLLAYLSARTAQAGDASGAERLLREANAAVDPKTEPDPADRSHRIAEGLLDAGDVVGALALAERLPKAWWGHDALLRRIVDIQASRKDFPGARRTVALLEAKPDRIVCLATIAYAQCRTGDREGGQKTLAEASALAAGPIRKQDRFRVLLALAAANHAAGNAEALPRLLDQATMITEQDARALRVVQVTRLSVGDLDGALKSIRTLPLNGSIAAEERRFFGLRDMAVALWRAGKTDEARAMFEEARTIPGTVASDLARAQTDVGDVASALSWIREQKDSKARAGLLLEVASQILEPRPSFRGEPSYGLMGDLRL